MKCKISGEGYIKLNLYQFDVTGRFLQKSNKLFLGDFSLTPLRSELEIMRRFQLYEKTHKIRFQVETIGRSNIKIDQMIMERLLQN